MPSETIRPAMAVLSSFMGQYRGLTPDIVQTLSPYVREQELDCSLMADQVLENAIDPIRSDPN